MIYLQLFWSFFQIGLLSFGGGLAAMPLIKTQAVDIHGWLTLTGFTDLITISEMTPGPITINSATFVGTQVAGFGGALVSTVGCILPSCIIVSLLAWLYGKYQQLTVMKGALAGLRPMVTALILSAGLSVLRLAFWGLNDSLNLIAVVLFLAGLIVLRKTKINPVFIILGSGVVGGAFYLLV